MQGPLLIYNTLFELNVILIKLKRMYQYRMFFCVFKSAEFLYSVQTGGGGEVTNGDKMTSKIKSYNFHLFFYFEHIIVLLIIENGSSS